jgi:outer membrane protein OmpA-like peptidoglycan-associated protein
MQRRLTQQVPILASILVGVLALTSAAFAEEHLRGVVTGRSNDGALIVRTDSSDFTVVLNEATKVRLRSGVRVTKVDVPSLIPGLRVDVQGRLESTTRFAADRITYTRQDLKIARDIAAGITPTNQAVADNRSLIDSHQQENAQRFGQQQQTLDQQGRQIANNDEKIVATNGRIANLDQYTVVDTLMVYFGNGRSEISPEYRAQLQQFAQKAKAGDGYTVQVEGYASAVGRDALNQHLSRERAEKVASILQQTGVPPTRMLVPAAMGVSDQVASNDTKEGQAQNRRTVIRLLQNRGITGN